jgi:hypothetical protein
MCMSVRRSGSLRSALHYPVIGPDFAFGEGTREECARIETIAADPGLQSGHPLTPLAAQG